VSVRTTIEISGPLLARAKRRARALGKPLRALVEEGLRRVLDAPPIRGSYKLQDHSVGRAGAPNPLESMSWQDLRDEIYGGK
jgi:hypothetical protein